GKSTSHSSSTTAARERKYPHTDERARPVRSARAGKLSASVPPTDSRERAAASPAARRLDRCAATEAARILGTPSTLRRRGPRRPEDRPALRRTGSAAEARQLRAQLEHGLGVDLAGPALGHAQHVADLGEREALVVVQRDH